MPLPSSLEPPQLYHDTRPAIGTGFFIHRARARPFHGQKDGQSPQGAARLDLLPLPITGGSCPTRRAGAAADPPRAPAGTYREPRKSSTPSPYTVRAATPQSTPQALTESRADSITRYTTESRKPCKGSTRPRCRSRAGAAPHGGQELPQTHQETPPRSQSATQGQQLPRPTRREPRPTPQSKSPLEVLTEPPQGSTFCRCRAPWSRHRHLQRAGQGRELPQQLPSPPTQAQIIKTIKNYKKVIDKIGVV